LKPLTPIAMSSPTMWKRLPPDQALSDLAGDAVVVGDPIAMVIRREGTGAEIHYKTMAGWFHHATLIPVGEEAARGVQDMRVTSNSDTDVTVEVSYKTMSSGPITVKFRIAAGRNSVETLPGPGALRLALQAPTRFAVLPTSAGDGLLIDATAVSGGRLESSGENAVLHMLDRGDLIVLSQWTSGETTVFANVSGADSGREVVSTEVPLSDGSVATSVFSLRGAWGERPVQSGAGGDGVHITWSWPVPVPWLEDGGPKNSKLARFEASADMAAGGGAVPFAIVYDTGSAADAPIPADRMAARREWDKIEEGDTAHAFLGDTVIMNDKLALAVRQTGVGIELYARQGNSFHPQAVLYPLGGGEIVRLSDVALQNNAPDSVVLDAEYATQSGGVSGIRCELNLGQVSVKTEALGATKGVRVGAPSRFVVLPDFFADDIVIDARDIGANTAELPSENFLMHMIGEGNGVVLTVWDNREQEVQVNLSGSLKQRSIDSSEITYGDGGAAWVAVLYDKGIWHEREISLDEKDKILPLKWQAPFPALWRVNWERSDGMTDSWEMLTEVSPGKFKKHGLFEENENSWTIEDWWGSGERTRIAAGLGRFSYPCWVGVNGQGFLQPLKEAVEFKGSAIIYPLNRLSATPLDKYTLVDVVRTSLGVGPCQYILDVEGQQEVAAGWPTCTVQDVLDEIYEKNQQAQERAEVEQAIKNVVDFITIIRKRIDAYETFGKEMQTYLTEAKGQYPTHAEFLDKLLGVTRQIDEHIAAQRESIKSIEFAKQLADEFRAEVLNDTSPGAVEKCKKYTSQWVDIGGSQDELVAECRMFVRVLRQRAGMALAQDPSLGPIVDEIRKRTQEMLRAPVNYEAARH
jgi:hypothetical protein